MIRRSTLSRCWRLPFALLCVVALVQAVFLGISSESLRGEPGKPELLPVPRVADSSAAYAQTVPAKNPTRLYLQDDGAKVLGWVAGNLDLKDRLVMVKVGGERQASVKLQPGNTFIWDYRVDKPTSVSFAVAGPDETWPITGAITVNPDTSVKHPCVFFVIDRTAYRPKQSLQFAGFLRRLNVHGEFEPIANTEVDVELVAQQKQTNVYKADLRSDANGKISGSYAFSESDPLDSYTLRIPGFKGAAKLLLGEYRKSKVRLKVTGDIKDDKLTLQFAAVDFLDKPVAASKLSFQAQVVENRRAEKTQALKAEDFAYFSPPAEVTFDVGNLADDDRLLWIADRVMPRPWVGMGMNGVAQFSRDMTLTGTDPGRFTIDLKKEWQLGNFSVRVEGTITDVNGHEQRGSHTVPLGEPKPGAAERLELARETFAAGEKFVARLRDADGKPIEGASSLLVMRLSPSVSSVPVHLGMTDSGGVSLRPSRYLAAGGETPARTLVSAVPFRKDQAIVQIAEPGAYKLIAITHRDDGRTTQTEIGCVVRPGDDLAPLALMLKRDHLNAGARLTGTIVSKFANAQILLTLRDSRGLRLWKAIALNERGTAQLDETLPAGLMYGCVLDLLYLDEHDVDHLLSRPIHVNPTDRTLSITTTMKNEVKPGETVKIGLQVDRQEEVDLVVSVYDRALLGISPDKSVDVRNFFLADDRVRPLPALDRLVRRLGDITVATLLDKAHAQLKTERDDETALHLKQLVQHMRTDKHLKSEDLLVLLRLAGIDVYLNPSYQHQAGLYWKFELTRRPGLLLREVIRHTFNQSHLVFENAGDVLLMHETASAKPIANPPNATSQARPIFSPMLPYGTYPMPGYYGYPMYYQPFGYPASPFGYSFSGIPLRPLGFGSMTGFGSGMMSMGGIGGFNMMGMSGGMMGMMGMSGGMMGMNGYVGGMGGGGFAGGGAFKMPQVGGGYLGGMGALSAAPPTVSGNATLSVPPPHGFIAHAQLAAFIEADPELMPIDIRRDFADSAYWNAAVRTDKQGKASVDFKVPDSLTNWQVVVTAVSPKMHVGQAKSAFRSFKPVMIWPMLPRSFVEGDVVELFGSVHNGTNQKQTMTVRLKAENGDILTPAERTVEVAAKSSAKVYWTFRPRMAGHAELLMSATCAAGVDASLKRLPVERPTAEQFLTKSGQVKGAGAVFTIPKEVDLTTARLEISFAPSLAADMADTLNYLVEYPYGCVEQTMSRFLPAVKVAQILKQYRVDHPELNQKLPLVVAAGIKRLLDLQQADGGWGWNGTSQTHELMTPYALYGLLQAEKAGYATLNETAIQRGLHRLRSFIDAMNDGQAADRIYCLYVYTHREPFTEEWVRFLDRMQQSGKLSDYANALCLSMCVAQKQDDLAKRFAADLRARAQKDVAGQVYWTTAGFSRWAEDRNEITAAVMRALVAYDVDDPLIDGILGYFNASKRGDRWNSTKDTATILLAMCDYLAKANYRPDAKGSLSLSVNGGPSRNVLFDDKLSKKLTIQGTNLKTGDNQLTFKTEMTGVMYRAVLRHRQPGRVALPMSYGIAVERKFYLWNEQTKQLGRQLTSGDTIPRGAHIICDMTATSTANAGMRYMLMECPKPSAAEIIPTDDPRFQALTLNSGYVLREDRLSSVAFHHEQAPQTVKNRMIMLVELAGDYTVPAAFVELMYQTETRGHSGTFSLKV